MSDLLATLIARGTPAALVADVAMLLARAQSAEMQLASRRAGDARRKARQRARERDAAGQKEGPPLAMARCGRARGDAARSIGRERQAVEWERRVDGEDRQ